jgi:hypothetical protein
MNLVHRLRVSLPFVLSAIVVLLACGCEYCYH